VQRNGKNYYLYADPTHYQIFVGIPSQYQRYQQLRLANNLAQDQLATAQPNNMTTIELGHEGTCEFLCNPSYCESYRPSAHRGTPPDTGSSNTGFRCVISGETRRLAARLESNVR